MAELAAATPPVGVDHPQPAHPSLGPRHLRSSSNVSLDLQSPTSGDDSTEQGFSTPPLTAQHSGLPHLPEEAEALPPASPQRQPLPPPPEKPTLSPCPTNGNPAGPNGNDPPPPSPVTSKPPPGRPLPGRRPRSGLGSGSGSGSGPLSPAAPSPVSPPYWQTPPPRHRATSSVSQSSITGAFAGGSKPAPIRLEDNTYPLAAGVRSPLWARVVRIAGHAVVAGTIRGVGDYVVWMCHVDTLDGGTIVLRKRYSEFERLRDELSATFPNAAANLPQLPPKSVLYKFRPGFLEKRRVGLEYFLNCILLNPEFASSAILKEFVFD